MPWPITGRTAFNPFCDEHGFLLWIRNLLLNKKQKIICVTEEVTAVISHSRPSIFYAIDYFHGNQSTSLKVKHTVIKLEFNKMNVSNFEDAFNNSSKSGFFGPSITKFKWDSKQTLSLQLTIGATAFACPWIIFLNMLVILAIKKIRELQKNSNILITHLAGTNLLVGAFQCHFQSLWMHWFFGNYITQHNLSDEWNRCLCTDHFMHYLASIFIADSLGGVCGNS